jgi:outer membrane protein assembly factor BamB
MRLSLRPLLLVLAVAASATFAAAGNWPQWRGPHGTGVSDETNVPVKWDLDNGILWKCPLPEQGASTPAIWGNAIFLTAQEGEKLQLLKLNKADGKVEWSRDVGTTGAMRRGNPKRKEHTFHRLHNMASPSPVTDGQLVVVHFGNGDLAAYDFAGKKLWLHNLQQEHGHYSIWWGHANSPVLWKDLVISVCMQDSLDDLQKEPAPSYLIAHDKRTGEQKWKTMRMTGSKAEDCDSYTTPIFRTVKDREEMIVAGANQIDAYAPATGKQLWFLPIKGSRTITGPTLGADLLFTVEGKRGALLAVRPGGAGKLPADAVVWRQGQSTPDSPCPVLWNDLLFVITDDGIAQCIDAKTGEQKWKERLQGDFKASPVAADGKVYFLNVKGQCTVVAALSTFEKLAENPVGDETVASPAIADGRLYLRGSKALYCVGAR